MQAYDLLILSFFIIIKASCADQNSSCNPSSCGDIRNISYPFRLKDDPQDCGDSNYEISCENNITAASIYVYSRKYHVQAINYQNYTIRLADPNIKNNDTCSFPSYFPNWYNLSRYNGFPYSIFSQDLTTDGRAIQIARPITFLSCPFPLNETPFIPTDTCRPSSSNTSVTPHTYIKFGYLYARDVRDLCRIDLVTMASSPLIYSDQENDPSLSEIHDSLQYGFEVSWSSVYCANKNCSKNEVCVFDGKKAVCLRDYCYKQFQMLTFEIELVVKNVSRYPFDKGSPWGQDTVVSCPTPWYYVAITNMLLLSEICAVILIVQRILIGLPFLIGILIHKFRTRHFSMFGMIEAFLQSQNMNLMPIRYSYADIKKMTRGFREKLGKGGYGSVYKGKLRSGTTVAVKVLNNPSGNGQDFINEVATIGRIHHVNVVELVGYCAERSKFALVYDFMSNGSLEKYIFNRESDSGSLSWDTKYKIAVGVARGIEYLHRGCNIQILHFDIKPHNILLAEDFTPKISDFGLAKSYSTEKNIVTLTMARGTIGYVAPELINRSIGGVSFKADVYSFGMLLMEMVGLKRNLAANDPNSSQYFPDWIYDRVNEDGDFEFEEADQTDDECRGKIKRMTIVALWCIQMSPDDRPSMSKVLEMLESDTEPLQIPPPPSELSQEVAENKWETYSDSVTLLVHDTSRSV
ncbi:LEAF RUST 10 DISEASE-RESISTANCEUS RECEPTOR-LIKE PROTEIN KINASE-like 2.3 [Henckelia pumila]|uniref:LEAF RUST 10 DISEASE-RESISTANCEUS RECEPTOR-LIKE PROTEIN KINASE-like 2.3 n=1 Tax=Henckelia pumila TaxID=405737 RepID=UPI003C6E0DA7